MGLFTRQFFITQLNRFETGKTKLTFLRTIAEMGVYGALAVKFFFGDASWAYWLIAPGVILLLLLFWGVGYLWDRAGLYEEEARFGMKRHLFFQQWLKKNDKVRGN